ncbi:OpgC domain-containing protein [Bradyrhizobium diazoefficiens]|uniref:OpgC domain-containing protein n=1 Tax=Bradyrhizobium diazoefficiens TaxID=1355477 RepID=UPI0019099DE8|nr:OpgC domain-containing protein [Bradyrhizobium diazoefficiens]MBK3664973.1 OpgC domain-containing protein [Bradyrhizobium diazoefficiens]
MVVAHYLPPKGRDLRLDLFRGIANWAIFLDHIPNNVLNLVTGRNFGFSDAADLFIFISGYTASFVYARIMVERGVIVGSTRLIKRVWTIYVAHVLLFVIYLAEIGYLAQKYGGDQFADEFNIHGFLTNPALTLYEGLILRFKPVNMDVLPLYIVLMGLFPPVLVAMLKRPNMVLCGSIVLYLVARAFGWNLPAYPVGHWYFNPFAWQLLFVFGAWFALGGSVESTPFIGSRAFLFAGAAYLIFALVVTLAGPFPELRSLIPNSIYSLFSPNDKTNLALYRVIHFAVIAFFVVRFLPRDWKGLESPLFAPAIVCGQQSLEVFCAGIFLSFAAHFVLVEVSGALPMQILVSVVGIGAMTGLAYYRSWSKRMDKAKPTPANPPKAAPASV